MKKELKFSYNWNNKLLTKSFTTIRMRNDLMMYDDVIVILNNKPIGEGTVIGKESILVKNLTETQCYLDSGYSKVSTLNIFKKMYSDKNLEITPLFIYLIKMNLKK